MVGRSHTELEHDYGTMECGRLPALPPTRIHATEAAVTVRFVRAMQAARRRREVLIGTDLFSDPAYDMLLELYALHLEQRRVSVSSLCDAAQIPGSTGVRWVAKFEKDGLVKRTEDRNDARRFWIELSPNGVERMRRYFELMPFGSFGG